jgi:hypothetical protein
MWQIKKLQGFNRKWAIIRNGVLKGHVEVDENGQFNGTLDLSKYDNTFRDVDYIKSLVFRELMEQDLLDEC